MRIGNKKIYHLEAWVVKVMNLYKVCLFFLLIDEVANKFVSTFSTTSIWTIWIESDMAVTHACPSRLSSEALPRRSLFRRSASGNVDLAPERCVGQALFHWLGPSIFVQAGRYMFNAQIYCLHCDNLYQNDRVHALLFDFWIYLEMWSRLANGWWVVMLWYWSISGLLCSICSIQGL